MKNASVGDLAPALVHVSIRELSAFPFGLNRDAVKLRGAREGVYPLPHARWLWKAAAAPPQTLRRAVSQTLCVAISLYRSASCPISRRESNKLETAHRREYVQPSVRTLLGPSPFASDNRRLNMYRSIADPVQRPS